MSSERFQLVNTKRGQCQELAQGKKKRHAVVYIPLQCPWPRTGLEIYWLLENTIRNGEKAAISVLVRICLARYAIRCMTRRTWKKIVLQRKEEGFDFDGHWSLYWWERKACVAHLAISGPDCHRFGRCLRALNHLLSKDLY